MERKDTSLHGRETVSREIEGEGKRGKEDVLKVGTRVGDGDVGSRTGGTRGFCRDRL